MPAASRHRAEHATARYQYHRHYADQVATRPTKPPNPVAILSDDFVCKISDGQQPMAHRLFGGVEQHGGAKTSPASTVGRVLRRMREAGIEPTLDELTDLAPSWTHFPPQPRPE